MITAKMLHDYQVTPRLMMLAISVSAWRVVEWYMMLEDPSVQQSGLVSVVMGAMTGMFAVWMSKEGSVEYNKTTDNKEN